MKYKLISSKSKQNYLFSCGIYPLDGFADYYQMNQRLRQALDDYDIRWCGFGTR